MSEQVDLTADEKRQVLQRNIKEYQTQGYHFLIESVAAEAQQPFDASTVEALKARSRNAYAAARRLIEVMSALDPSASKE